MGKKTHRAGSFDCGIHCGGHVCYGLQDVEGYPRWPRTHYSRKGSWIPVHSTLQSLLGFSSILGILERL